MANSNINIKVKFKINGIALRLFFFGIILARYKISEPVFGKFRYLYYFGLLDEKKFNIELI